MFLLLLSVSSLARLGSVSLFLCVAAAAVAGVAVAVAVRCFDKTIFRVLKIFDGVFVGVWRKCRGKTLSINKIHYPEVIYHHKLIKQMHFLV